MPGQLMEAPLQQLPAMQQAFNCKHAAATDMACLQPQQPSGNAGAREQCPRCASHDTKFCYYNNYNTSQPRHFCRACRRYWTLGGSLRNVPIGGSTRKRLRPAPPAVRRPHAHFGGGPPQPSSHSHQAQHGLLSSLFALGAGPLLEGRVGFDLGLGLPGLGSQAGLSGGRDQLGGLHALGLRAGPGGTSAPLLWPAGLLENGHNVDAWKVSGSAAAGMWAPEFSAATATSTASQMVHGGAQML